MGPDSHHASRHRTPVRQRESPRRRFNPREVTTPRCNRKDRNLSFAKNVMGKEDVQHAARKRTKEIRRDDVTDSGGSFQDPASAQNKTVPVHRWAPWVAGYSKAFAEDAIEQFASTPDQLVLDPFAGVGTTLLEATRLGHRALGFEINPYAAFAATIKLQCYRLNTGEVRRTSDRLNKFWLDRQNDGAEPESTKPAGFNTRSAFYSPHVLRKVLLFLDFVKYENQENEDIANLLKLAFAATMVQYSNYSYEPSLGRKQTVGRPEVTDFPVFEFISEKLTEFADDAEWFQKNRKIQPTEEPRIHRVSFLQDYRRVAKHAANLVLTSPPYMNNYHYNRNTRPQLYWLDFYQSPQELKALEAMNFGTSWQIARDQKHVPLNPDIQNPEIHQALEDIRNKNPEGNNNGSIGWANYAATYLNDCAKFMKALKWTLHPEGTALIVIGNSIIQGIPVPTDRFLAIIAQECGLEPRSIETPRLSRVGDSIVNSAVRNGQVDEGNHLYESVVNIGQVSSRNAA